jgi:hypothetical protein
MALQNDIILFGSTCTDIVSQATYAADPNTAGGRPSGIFPSNVCNKILRQSSYGSAALAQLVVSYGLQPVVDNGNLSTFVANLVTAIQAISTSSAPSAPPVAPGGRLTLTTGTPLINADVTGSTVVYYTPAVNASLPIYNGAAWTNYQQITDLSLSLTSAAAANDIVDVFACVSGGSPVLGFGPVWATNTPGSCARGVGAGTTQISRVNNGLWANTNIITLTNGASTYTNIPVGQATYLGSIAVDAVAGQTSCYLSWGQSRKWGVWNAYNRLPVCLQVGDSTASWTIGVTSWRSSNGNAANALQTFTGLPEEFLALEFVQLIQAITGSGSTYQNGIGYNSSSSPLGKVGQVLAGVPFGSDGVAKYNASPSLGLNTVYALEDVQASSAKFYGGSTLMLLSACYRA